MLKDYLTNDMQKQHINLSSYAWDIINSDMHLFSDTARKPSLSGFLNRVFINGYAESAANLTSAADARTEYYRKVLSSGIKDEPALKSAADALIDADIAALTNQLLSYPRGDGKKFRLSNAAFDIICSIPEESFEDRIYKKPGTLLKAFFETYCRQPFINREQIYFAEHLEKFRQAIKFRSALTVTLLNGMSFSMIPYKIISGVISDFTYIAGMSKETGGCDYKYASFRLSRIRDISTDYKNKLQLSENNMRELDSLISSKGVPFLLNDIVTAKVRLTEAGVRKYNTQLHLRPRYDEKTAGNVFTFPATREQILFYFFKFGQDAEILEPAELRDEFRRLYAQALELYA